MSDFFKTKKAQLLRQKTQNRPKRRFFCEKHNSFNDVTGGALVT